MKIITFIDSIGRNIIGVDSGSTDTTISVNNPAMINVAQAQNGQLQVQLIPLFFAEFIDQATRTNGSTWKYNLSSITLGDVEVDARLVDQYTKVFSVSPVAPQVSEDSVIKLFDE